MSQTSSPSEAAGTLPATELFLRLLRIRYLEESLLELYSQGLLFGTTHTSIGQEAVAVSVMEALDLERDVVFSSHRCHGHFLAYGGDLTSLIAEIMGRATGVCAGMGGSQHVKYRNFHSNGIQGGIVPLAVGSALGERYQSTGAIATVFLGDGTLGEGAVYEAFNMASLWSVPTLFVLEDNGYAQTTPRDLALAGSITARAQAFGVDADSICTNDVDVLLPLMRQRVASVRDTGRPFLQVVETYRLAPHSKGDDFRDPQEIESWRARDPVAIVGARLSPAERAEIESQARTEVDEAIKRAEAAAWPEGPGLQDLVATEGSLVPGTCEPRAHADPDPTSGLITVGRDLNAALHTLLAGDQRVVLVGEDLLDPYGGAFKMSKGLSTRFPDRVLTSPISEAGLVGVCNGMALRGMRPIAEIMFGDFVTLAADQIINHAAKFAGMYAGQASCPVTIRTPMGGGRGYGPTHSQSIEAMFLGVPGLEVVAVSPVHPVGELLANAVLRSERPTLFVENKVMYAKPLMLPDEDGYVGSFAARHGSGLYPTVHLSLDDFEACDAVIVAYGGMVEVALEAAEQLLVEEEITCDVLAPSQLSPLPIDDLLEPALRAGRALVVEEGTRAHGWGAEVAASLHERGGERLASGRVRRLGARPFTIPVSRPLEDHVLPRKQDVFDAILALVGETP